MNDAGEQLSAAMSLALPRLRAVSEDEASRGRGPGKWVKKEILGHLIDSAVNNHQRFVRAPMVDRFVWPGYEQDAWISAQNYKARAWSDLVDLWSALNRHLAHVMASIPRERLGTQCVIGSNEPATLEWWITDYVRHLRHHLEQLLAE